MEVEPRTQGRLPRELRQGEIKVIPDTVQLFIWRSFKSSTTKIYTETIDLSRLTATSELKAKLVVPQHMRLESDQPAEVNVKLDIIGDTPERGGIPPGGQ